MSDEHMCIIIISAGLQPQVRAHSSVECTYGYRMNMNASAESNGAAG